MNIKELASEIKTIKIPDKGWENIHFVIPPPPPRELKEGLPYSLIGEALRVLASLPAPGEMDDLDRLVSYLFVRREVVQSSRLEGTWSTLDHALTPGELVDVNEGKDKHQAVRAYANLIEEVVQEGIEKRESVFTVELISRIQQKIVERDPNSSGVPGKIRTLGEPGSIVTIGGGIRRENSIYNPAPPQEVLRCLKETLNWFSDTELAELGDAGAGLSLPVRLALGHAHFEAVHPFTDGNGRTGRTLWPLQMVCAGFMPLYLSGYVEAHRQDYTNALQQAQKKLKYAPLVEFVCNAIIESDLEAKATKNAIKELIEVWQSRGGFREKSSAKRALKLLVNYPIVTAQLLQDKLGISSTASLDAVNALVDKKILRFRHRENRKKVFVAEEIIQILARPFGSEIDLALEKAASLLKL